jgi:Flp pilus assembly protein TadG
VQIVITSPKLRPTRQRVIAIRGDCSGIALLEFALALPIFVGLTMVGMETVNLAYASQKVGDVATLTTDQIARIRIGISEGDITESLNGIKDIGSTMGFAANGRIIVSSVQPILDSAGTVTSSYGAAGASLGVAGIGPSGRKIAAGPNDEVIFVEVVYAYQPLISNSFLGARTLRSITGMTVRERKVNDVQSTGTASPCTQFSA